MSQGYGDSGVKLIGILSWYDEPAWCLTELIASAAKAGMDALVAVDGAYMLFPGGRGQSPSEQAQAIQAACQGAGVELLLHIPREPWMGNEVEKRSFAFQLAETVAMPMEDWFWILDADEVVTEALGLREALEDTGLDAAEVLMEEVLEDGRSGIVPMRKFFRCQPTGIRVETNHYTFKTGAGQLLYQGFQTPSPDLVEAEHLGFVRFDHRNGRSEQRERDAQTYYDRRRELGAELVPG